MFKETPMFYGDSNYDVLFGILSFYGKQELEKYIEKFNLTVSDYFKKEFLVEDLDNDVSTFDLYFTEDNVQYSERGKIN